jgi:hypothetical protein
VLHFRDSRRVNHRKNELIEQQAYGLQAVNLISSQVAGAELNRGKSASSDQIGFVRFSFSFLDWPLQDPQGKPIESARKIRDEIRERVVALATLFSVLYKEECGHQPDRQKCRTTQYLVMSDVVVPLYRRKTPERMQITATANPRFPSMLSAATLEIVLL